MSAFGRASAALCIVLSGFSNQHASCGEPERTSWTLRDASGKHTLALQLRQPAPAGRLWPELHFDTKFCSVELNEHANIALTAYHGKQPVLTDRPGKHELRMFGRVLVWRNVDGSMIPDTAEYRLELIVENARFRFPNELARHFIIPIDPSWGITRVEPPIVVEDSAMGEWSSPILRYRSDTLFAPRDYFEPRVIPIPPADSNAKVLPIPNWDGKRTVIPLPNNESRGRNVPPGFFLPERRRQSPPDTLHRR